MERRSADRSNETANRCFNIRRPEMSAFILSILLVILAVGFGQSDEMVNVIDLKLHSSNLETIDDLAFAPYSGNLRSLSLFDNRLTEIPIAALQHTPNLLNLYLRANFISTVPTRAFESLKKLESIDLRENYITIIEPEAFAGLPNLKSLTLRDNRIVNVSLDIFKYKSKNESLENLTYLSLAGNRIMNIDKEAFVGLTKLKKLDLSYNRLYQVPTTLRHTPGLEKLLLNSNQISTIESGAFKSFNLLILLDLKINKIETVGEEAFSFGDRLIELVLYKNLLKEIPDLKKTTHLLELNLANNNISTIPTRAFESLKQLKTIDLRYNGIFVIEPEAFTGLSSLDSLDLSHNQLAILYANCFKGISQPNESLENFTKLDLRHNQITTIDEEAFNGLTKLQQLLLLGNYLSQVPTEALKRTPGLKLLSLSGNRFSTIRSRAFESLTLLNSLSITGNQIPTIEPDAFAGLLSLNSLILHRNKLITVAPNIFMDMSRQNMSIKNLTELDLSYNHITTIDKDAFFGLANLKELNLVYNNLSQIPTAAFRQIPGLKKLYLERNQILTIESRAFESLQLLDSLSLFENQIVTIKPDAFAGLSKLRDLSLRNNRLVETPPNVFKELAQKENICWISLHFNPWTCDCFFKSWPKQGIENYWGVPECDYNGQQFKWYDQRVLNITQMCCPRNCRCDFDTKSIDCSGLGFEYEDVTRLNIDEETNELSLANNRLKKFDSSLWAGRNRTLKMLDLSKNQITVIETQSFIAFMKLERLILNNNKLVVIKPFAFSGLYKLKHLDLMNNLLEQLPEDFINILSNDIEANDKSGLLLANNPWHCNCNLSDAINFLKQFPPVNGVWPICQQPQHLKDKNWLHNDINIFLTGCSKFSCPVTCFCYFRYFQYISPGNYRLERKVRFPNRNLITDCSSRSIEKIEGFVDPITYDLSLKKNLLTSLDKSSFKPNMTRLGILDVSFCYLRKIEDQAFYPFSGSLQKLDLTNNELTKVPTAAIRQTTSLVELYLKQNYISTIPSRAFETLNKLQVLDLDHNKITIIQQDAFKGLWKLKKLHLYENKLVGIPENVFEEMAKQMTLEEIYLNRNPWRCGCYLKWAKRAYLNTPSQMHGHWPSCRIVDCEPYDSWFWESRSCDVYWNNDRVRSVIECCCSRDCRYEVDGKHFDCETGVQID